MSKIILVTGGARSGKSDYAQQRVESMKGPRCFVATCMVRDSEMEDRVGRHRKARKGCKWNTVEEPYDLGKVFSEETGEKTFLVDCLTLWISNIMERAAQQDLALDEDEIEKLVRTIVTIIREKGFTVVFVTNEVGMGIVPENAVARKYRDLVGKCNRVCAELADEAFFICAGMPVRIK